MMFHSIQRKEKLNGTMRGHISLLADKLCLSERQLHRKIAALTGDSPASFIQRVRMEHARHMLSSNPELTVEMVAEHCGFDSYSTFCHIFKKHYKHIPLTVAAEKSLAMQRII